MYRLCKSIIPLFSATLMVSVVGCSNIPNPFGASYSVPPLQDAEHFIGEVKLSVAPAMIHPADKFFVRGLFIPTPEATISTLSVSVQIMAIEDPSKTTSMLVEKRVLDVPKEGLILAEEFTAPVNIGTYSAVLNIGNTSYSQGFAITK